MSMTEVQLVVFSGRGFIDRRGDTREPGKDDKNVLHLDLGRRSAHFFWKGPHRQYFQLCGPEGHSDD